MAIGRITYEDKIDYQKQGQDDRYKEKNAAQAKDQLLRMAAEYENYRKRSTREADQKFNDGVSFAVNQIIPILDTLEMAANAPTTDEN